MEGRRESPNTVHNNAEHYNYNVTRSYIYSSPTLIPVLPSPPSRLLLPLPCNLPVTGAEA